MTRINRFDTAVQCEEFYTVDPEEMAEVLAAPAVDDSWQGYSEWSREVETSLAPSTLYIDPKDGKVKQIPEPPSRGRIDGIEI
jgi:hypothetical protein